MAHQMVMPGQALDIPTADEIVRLLPRPPLEERVRASATVALIGGIGQDEVYKVPMGAEFHARRVVCTLTGSVPNDPNTNNVLLNAAGKFVAYLRSGALIEYGQPTYGSAIQVPGVQTWSGEQGPYLRNGEVFELYASLTGTVVLSVYLEGILKRPSTEHQ